MNYKVSPFCISGNSLPLTLYNVATVDHEESFMIYGGFTGSSRSDKIYKYNTDGGQWDEVPTTISEAKELMTPIKVKKSIFKACQPGNLPISGYLHFKK